MSCLALARVIVCHGEVFSGMEREVPVGNPFTPEFLH